MYFHPHGGRVYRNHFIEAMRLIVIYDDAAYDGFEWPLPDYWPVIPEFGWWRLNGLSELAC